MSETFSHTRDALRRLKAELRAADEDTIHKFAYWCIGLASMGGAIVFQFGWTGALFCVGLIFWTASNAESNRS